MDTSTLFNMSMTLISTYLICHHPVSADIANMPKFLAYDEEIDCLSEESPQFPVISPPWNSPFRAHKSIPPLVHLTESTIQEAVVGIQSKIFIKKYTWLGEYEGEIIRKLSQISDYAWKVKRNGYAYFYVDAHDVHTSNWLRWINCSRHASEENVGMLECKGKVFYITIKDIHPGQELFVYYGDRYAKDLNIDVRNYSTSKEDSDNSNNKDSRGLLEKIQS